MTSMHRIRLAGPWHFWLQHCDGSQLEFRQKTETPLPENALEKPIAAIRMVRKFNRPSGLLPTSRVYLELEDWPTYSSVALNQSSISNKNSPIEITQLLVLGQNAISIECQILPDERRPVQTLFSNSTTYLLIENC